MAMISLALDRGPLERAFGLACQLCKLLRSVKIHSLLDRFGPKFLEALRRYDCPVWVDYKLHDTPETVAERVRALVDNGAKIITVHASSGVAAMRAAVETAGTKAEIYAVTLLTSLGDEEIGRIYDTRRTRKEIAHELALMAQEAGVKTVTCSALEVAHLKHSRMLTDMRFVVPGTRSAGVSTGHHKRTGTPAQAVADGADELVIGRQATEAADPLLAFSSFAAEAGE